MRIQLRDEIEINLYPRSAMFPRGPIISLSSCFHALRCHAKRVTSVANSREEIREKREETRGRRRWMVRLCKYCLYNGFTGRFRTLVISSNIVQYSVFVHLFFSSMQSLPATIELTSLYSDHLVISVANKDRNNKVRYIGYSF